MYRAEIQSMIRSMKTTLTSLAVILCSYLSFAQTDIIEMRSRGASLKKYEHLSKIKGSYHVPSNFGMAPEPLVKTAVLDSIKVISDSSAVVFTSNYCTRGYYPEPELVLFDSNGRQLNEPRKVYRNPRVGHLWQPGADTVINHPIFTQRHSLDSIKDVIDRDYHFNLPSDSITFIGFDNGQVQRMSNEDSVQPVKHRRKKKENSFGWELMFMIVSPIAFFFGMNRLTSKRLVE
jgi:hypothetical protein